MGIDNLCHALLDAAEANIPVVRAGALHVFVATIYATDSRASINGGMAENVGSLGFGPFNGFGIFRADIASSGTSAPSLLGRYERWQGNSH